MFDIFGLKKLSQLDYEYKQMKIQHQKKVVDHIIKTELLMAKLFKQKRKLK